MITFRNVILEDDYFGNVYSKYNEVKDFIKTNSLETLDDPEKYPQIILYLFFFNFFDIINHKKFYYYYFFIFTSSFLFPLISFFYFIWNKNM